MRSTYRMSPRAGILLICIVLVPAAIKFFYYPAYPGSDDSFIHLAMAKNITAGLGWGIAPHEHVNLSTSPLYTLLLTLADKIGLNPLHAAKALSLLFTTASLLLMYLFISRIIEIHYPLLHLAVVTAAAFNIHLWRWNGVVMETSMAFFFVGLIFYLHYVTAPRSRCIWASRLLTGLAAGLGTLTRPELSLLAPCLLLDVLINQRNQRARGFIALLAGFAAVICFWLLFSMSYFHSLLPTTFHAKTSSLRFINREVLTTLSSVVASAYIFPLLAGAFLLIKGLSGPRRGETVSILLKYAAVFLFPVLLFAFYYLKVPYMESAARYYLPALYCIPIAVALFAGSPSLDKRPPRSIVAAVLALQILTALYINHTRIAPVLRGFTDNYWRAMREVVTFLEENCEETDTVLVEVDIGMLAYYGNHNFRLADGKGLASPELLHKNLTEKISSARPKYVVESLGSSLGGLADRDPRLRLEFYRAFKSHGVRSPDLVYYCNVFRTEL